MLNFRVSMNLFRPAIVRFPFPPVHFVLGCRRATAASRAPLLEPTLAPFVASPVPCVPAPAPALARVPPLHRSPLHRRRSGSRSQPAVESDNNQNQQAAARRRLHLDWSGNDFQPTEWQRSHPRAQHLPGARARETEMSQKATCQMTATSEKRSPRTRAGGLALPRSAQLTMFAAHWRLPFAPASQATCMI